MESDPCDLFKKSVVMEMFSILSSRSSVVLFFTLRPAVCLDWFLCVLWGSALVCSLIIACPVGQHRSLKTFFPLLLGRVAFVTQQVSSIVVLFWNLSLVLVSFLVIVPTPQCLHYFIRISWNVWPWPVCRSSAHGNAVCSLLQWAVLPCSLELPRFVL